MEEAQAIMYTSSSQVAVANTNMELEKVEANTNKGRVVQRNYILNDVAALKKKLRAEGKKNEVSIGKEAKDASNITVPMKASFFEFVKEHFINDLNENLDIVKIDNAVGTKAATDSFGDAFVEYSVEITFKVTKHVHCIKLTAYTTTSQLVIQPIGEKSGPKEHLSQKGTPRFFVENFLLPWCSQAISEKRYNENLASTYLTALKEVIRKLDINKLDQRKANKGPTNDVIDANDVTGKADAKCVAKVCNFQGTNPQNKAAVGVCAICGNVEHFACVKIKANHKDDIVKGVQRYTCSSCFTKKPSLISPEVEKSTRSRDRLDSLPLMGQGSLLRISHSVSATPVSSDASLEMKKCENCDYETTSLQDMRKHLDANHKPKCSTCNMMFQTTGELSLHIETEHNIQCNICDKNFRDKKGLEEHIETEHNIQCNICDEKFRDKKGLEAHNQDIHTHVCTFCKNIFSTTDELKKHTDNQHRFICQACDQVFNHSSEIDLHMNTIHKFHCSKCDTLHNSQAELMQHMENEHNIPCKHCDKNLSNKEELEKHLAEEHCQQCNHCDKVFHDKHSLEVHEGEQHKSGCGDCQRVLTNSDPLHGNLNDIETTTNETTVCSKEDEENLHECEICNDNFKTRTQLKDHISNTHSLHCRYCLQELKDKDDLKKHIETQHIYDCEMCRYTGTGEETMEDHILEKHAHPDENGMYKCNECAFQSGDKYRFGEHHKTTHGSQSVKPNSNIGNKSFEETERLKNELRQLKNNMGRLETIYHEALEETNNIKSEYEAKLIKANDELSVVKAENEALKEKVDILFKLGRSYLDKTKQKEKDETQTNDTKEVIDIECDGEQTDVNLESLEVWATKKLRGFKRVNPAVTAELTDRTNLRSHGSDKQRSSPPSSLPSRHPVPSPSPSPSPPALSSNGPAASPEQNTQSEKENTQYQNKFCHFFVNMGRCNYEERTGKKCKFLHRQAPMCRMGINCNRLKCMFSHPKMNGSANFLGNPRSYSSAMNPLQLGQMINPWMVPIQNQYMTSPWNLQNQNQNIWQQERMERGN